MPKTKVLILHTSVGYGIKITAENIYEQLKDSTEFDVRIEDIQKVDQGRFGKYLEKIYLLMLDKFAFVWGFLYRSKLVLWLSLPFRKPLASFKSKKILQLLREYQPAIVISTQTAPTGVVAYLKAKGMYRGKLVAVFSDFHLHRFWLYPEVDLNVCAIAEQAEELRALGFEESKIALTGMFIGKKFFSSLSKEQARMEGGFLSSMPVVLMTSGGRARSEAKEIFLKLLRSPKSFQIAVVCGNNQELKDELAKISPPTNHPVKIFGYVNNMEVLMAAADVMVGKTGGPTMGETVVKRLPMVLTQVRPGHEEANLEFLVRNKIAYFARIPRELVFLVEQVLDGKLKIDWDHATATLIKPKCQVDLLEVLIKIRPESLKPKITNYQGEV